MLCDFPNFAGFATRQNTAPRYYTHHTLVLIASTVI